MFPSSIFGTEERPIKKTRELFAKIDRLVSGQDPASQGHYVFLILERLEEESQGLLRVMTALQESGIPSKTIHHSEVISISDAQEALGIPLREMVKTVIFRRTDSGHLVVALVSGEHRVDPVRFAEVIGCKASQLVLPPASEIKAKTGFPIGGVSPFGYDSSVAVWVDRRLRDGGASTLYMGAGNNTSTLLLTKENFLLLLNITSKATSRIELRYWGQERIRVVSPQVLRENR